MITAAARLVDAQLDHWCDDVEALLADYDMDIERVRGVEFVEAFYGDQEARDVAEMSVGVRIDG